MNDHLNGLMLTQNMATILKQYQQIIIVHTVDRYLSHEKAKQNKQSQLENSLYYS